MAGVGQNKTKHLIMEDLSEKDTIPGVFQFQPRRVAGVHHLPSMFDKHNNPVSFFKLFLILIWFK